MQRKIGVIGLGYVGLPLLLHLHSYGASVVGYDLDESLLSKLQKGESRNPHIELEALRDLNSDTTSDLTSDGSKLESCETIVVCVPTPLKSDGQIELKYLEQAVKIINLHMTPETLIINESTSFPGTLRKVFFNKLSENSNRSFYLATAPERIDPGNPMPLMRIPRVVGGIDLKSTQRAFDFYNRFFEKVLVVSSPEIAEMSKLLENTFRHVNISLINEFNDLCRRSNIDTREVIEAANSKPFGFMKFVPSAGIGGHCIPVDPEYLQYFAQLSGAPLKLVSAASDVNNKMGEVIVKRIARLLHGRNPLSALILGVAYKPNIPDIRDTPAKAILQALNSQGINVDWHDPLVEQWHGKKSSSLKDGSWEVGIVVTAHDLLDIELAKTKCKTIFDCTGRYSHIPEIVQI